MPVQVPTALTLASAVNPHDRRRACGRIRTDEHRAVRFDPHGLHRAAVLARRVADFRNEWGREDSNLRRLSRRVYSPFPLAARAHPRNEGRIVASEDEAL